MCNRGASGKSTWLTTIVINSARMKLRWRLATVQVALDETDGADVGFAYTQMVSARLNPPWFFGFRQ